MSAIQVLLHGRNVVEFEVFVETSFGYRTFAGDRLTLFSFRHWMFGCISATWTVAIGEVSDSHFIDEMLKGPMAALRHEHWVSAAQGGTLYTDRVTCAAIGGAPLEWLMVNAYMQRIFRARHRNMLQLLG